MFGFVPVRLGLVGSGQVRQLSCGKSWFGKAWCGLVRFGRLGAVRLCEFSLGEVMCGRVSSGLAGMLGSGRVSYVGLR